MKKLSSQEFRILRNKFWESKQHKHLPEVSLIADKESTAMFNVAGMQQLIPYLMGKPHNLGKRVYNIQRCIRTVDIDEVGDSSHLTFFEMMWNWSLWDYFKKDAIEWSWEFLTSPEYLAIDPRKLAVTVFEWDQDAPKDEESFSHWKNIGIPETKISYLPAKDNRWSPWPVGPCGPDTEIFYRVGEWEFPPADSNVANDEDNWLEIWNNVFMEFYRDESSNLSKLSQQNVDTGMWFERMCKVLQEKETIYETDIFWPIIESIQKHTGESYQKFQRRMRIVADHLRTAIVLINDWASPSNIWPGYVLRMIIRRAYYNLILIKDSIADSYEDLLQEILDFVVNFHSLQNKSSIFGLIQDELSQFQKTIANWIKLLQQLIDKKPEILDWKSVFMLYDTYGFPLELTREIAAENWIQLDENWFQKSMTQAREKSRQWSKEMFQKWIDRSKYLEWISTTEFIGYARLDLESPKLIKDFEVDGQRILIFDKTPFYAESGGQTGDKWKIILDDWTELDLIDVKKYEWVFLHFVA